MMLLLIANIMVYLIYEKSEENNQKLIELEMANQKSEIDMRYLNLLEKKNETMNIMSHDYKNHMLTISEMSDSPEIKKYIDNMVGEMSKYSRMGKTKNRLLDVILSKYTDICEDKGIKFETDIVSENLKFFSSYDMSSILNNILDNAVEAAEHSSEKFIRLEIANSLNSYYKIVEINSCDTAPKTRNGMLLTTKENREIHGLGTKSIKRIVSKYGGEMQWEYEESSRQFKFMAVFPVDNTVKV